MKYFLKRRWSRNLSAITAETKDVKGLMESCNDLMHDLKICVKAAVHQQLLGKIS